jgi:hypothetical protein
VLFAQISLHPLGDPPKWSVARIRLQFEQILGGATEENRLKVKKLSAEPQLPLL